MGIANRRLLDGDYGVSDMRKTLISCYQISNFTSIYDGTHRGLKNGYVGCVLSTRLCGSCVDSCEAIARKFESEFIKYYTQTATLVPRNKLMLPGAYSISMPNRSNVIESDFIQPDESLLVEFGDFPDRLPIIHLCDIDQSATYIRWKIFFGDGQASLYNHREQCNLIDMILESQYA